MVKPRSIDDVPILALTLWSKRYGDFELRRIAAQVDDTIKQTPDVSAVSLIGGQRRELRITLNQARLAAYRLSPLQIMGALGTSNRRLSSGEFASGNQEYLLETGQFLTCADDVRKVVAGVADGKPIFVRDVAEVTDGGEEPSQYVRFSDGSGFYPAVTIAISKRKGTNAVTVSENVLHRLGPLRGSVIPSDVQMTITRDYGDTAKEKSNELLWHMLIAVVSVSVLIAITLGFRESLIVFTAIPVTLALTLTVFYLYGYTLNRITLFALIFSIGILVDDAIVVVENIVRHWRMSGNQDRQPFEVAIEAVDEVGNPTILATLTVVAAILPMAFVGGLMGPYMRPIPIGASAAMVFSLLVAFMVTPWAAVRILKSSSAHHAGEREAFVTRLYRTSIHATCWEQTGMPEAQLIRCPVCGATNRVPLEKIEQGLAPVCGRCKNPLPVSIQPIKVTDATFSADVERSPLPVLLDLWAAWCRTLPDDFAGSGTTRQRDGRASSRGETERG